MLRRGAGLWLLLRLGILALGFLLDVAPVRELVFLTAPAAALVAGLATWMTLFDARRRGESLYLADLGVPARGVTLLAAAAPVAGELLVRTLGSP